MNKIRKDAGLDTRCAYAYQVSRFLAVKKQPDLKVIVDTATDACIARDRAVDDLERPVQEAVADRILAGFDLAGTARLVSRQLLARSEDPRPVAPHTDVFPKGLAECTEASQADLVYRYNVLIGRMEAALPPDDPTRIALVPVLLAQVEAWKQTDAAVDAANATQDLARAARGAAITAWDLAIDQAYGLLLARVGKAEAEKCFPKHRRPKPVAAASPAASTADPDDPTPEEPTASVTE